MVTYTPAPQPIMDTNGVIDNGDFVVSHTSGMDIEVSAGEAFIRGDVVSDAIEPFTIADNNTVDVRFDLVVLHVDLVAETADVRVLEGTLNPTQNNVVWELPLAGIGIPPSATNLAGQIQNLRVFSNDFDPKTLTTITKSTDTLVESGKEVCLFWDTPTHENDIYRFALLNTYISPRVSAFFNVHSAIRWEPANPTPKPVVFTVYSVDLPSYRTTQIYSISSAQLSGSGDVDFTFDQTLQIAQGNAIYMTVKNTTDEDITIKYVADTFPLFRMQFTVYPAEMF